MSGRQQVGVDLIAKDEIIKLLPSLKKEHEWLSEVPSQVLQQAALNLSSAFLNFFEGRAKYPNFKKKQNRQSIRFPQHCKLKDDVLVLPKIGEVSCQVSRQPEGNLKSVTVSVNPSGEYFASCLYDDGQDLPQKSSKNIRDEGLRIVAVGHTATASGGRVRPSKGTAFARHLPVNEESLA